MTDMEVAAIAHACKVALKSLFENSNAPASINASDFEALIAELLRIALKNGLAQHG